MKALKRKVTDLERLVRDTQEEMTLFKVQNKDLQGTFQTAQTVISIWSLEFEIPVLTFIDLVFPAVAEFIHNSNTCVRSATLVETDANARRGDKNLEKLRSVLGEQEANLKAQEAAVKKLQAAKKTLQQRNEVCKCPPGIFVMALLVA